MSNRVASKIRTGRQDWPRIRAALLGEPSSHRAAAIAEEMRAWFATAEGWSWLTGKIRQGDGK